MEQPNRAVADQIAQLVDDLEERQFSVVDKLATVGLELEGRDSSDPVVMSLTALAAACAELLKDFVDVTWAVRALATGEAGNPNRERDVY